MQQVDTHPRSPFPKPSPTHTHAHTHTHVQSRQLCGPDVSAIFKNPPKTPVQLETGRRSVQISLYYTTAQHHEPVCSHTHTHTHTHTDTHTEFDVRHTRARQQVGADIVEYVGHVTLPSLPPPPPPPSYSSIHLSIYRGCSF